MSAAVSQLPVNGRHDPAARKRAQRHGREKGCRVNIAAEQLAAAGIDPNGSVPFYTVRAWPRGRFLVTLYREP